MATSKRLKILIAIDDSPAAKAAIATVLRFPWPQATQVRGVVALQAGESRLQSKQLDDVLEAGLRGSADLARNALAARSGDAEVVGVNKPPIEAILGEAKASRANIIALGWRGHGSFRRLLAGSVSRTVAARAESSILIVRSAPQAVRRFLIGYDDSPNARRAIKLLTRLEPARGSRAVLVNVIELIAPTGIQPLRKVAQHLATGTVVFLREQRGSRRAQRRNKRDHEHDQRNRKGARFRGSAAARCEAPRDTCRDERGEQPRIEIPPSDQLGGRGRGSAIGDVSHRYRPDDWAQNR